VQPPLPFRPAILCRRCGKWIGAPAVTEVTTAAVTAPLLAKFGARPETAAFIYLAATGVALAQIDAAAQRLLDGLTLPAYPAIITLLALAAATGHDWASLLRSTLAAGAGYLLIALASRGQLGGGDIKLAGLTGLALSYRS
jgi:leader peptidase (prepilin peptidase)/N-methyltransferase